MKKQRKKPIIGILGGIGSGKSTVAGEFARFGCAVIDADKIAHNLLQEPPIKDKVVSLFGAGLLDTNGNIDRQRLGEIVFSNMEKLSLLTDMIHPPVLDRTALLIEQFQHDDSVKAIVLDMPLLMEVGWDKRCDTLIFVECDRQKRVQRAKKSGIFNENQLKFRENFQISLDKKRNIAENTIDNNSGLMALARQVSELFPKVVRSN
ncbi:MAG: dephospho-CoA kinase [Sedimentisphaerales bacterium]|nr:dephospho-CoA kinase [Sedimentisphaerales bacterium]